MGQPYWNGVSSKPPLPHTTQRRPTPTPPGPRRSCTTSCCASPPKAS